MARKAKEPENKMPMLYWVVFQESHGGNGGSHFIKAQSWNMPGQQKRMLCGNVGDHEYMLKIGELAEPFDLKEAAERGDCEECTRIALRMFLDTLDF